MHDGAPSPRSVGRAALQVAYWVTPKTAGVPLVFASRYGISLGPSPCLPICSRRTALAVELQHFRPQRDRAMFSIARQDRTAYTAVAAGEETVEAAIVEALGFLAKCP